MSGLAGDVGSGRKFCWLGRASGLVAFFRVLSGLVARRDPNTTHGTYSVGFPRLPRLSDLIYFVIRYFSNYYQSNSIMTTRIVCTLAGGWVVGRCRVGNFAGLVGLQDWWLSSAGRGGFGLASGTDGMFIPRAELVPANILKRRRDRVPEPKTKGDRKPGHNPCPNSRSLQTKKISRGTLLGMRRPGWLRRIRLR